MSALHVTRTSTGVRVWFVATNGNGSRRTGISGSITVTIIRDDDAANNTPTVSESTQVAGVYFADVPSVFLTTTGNNYAVLVEVTLAPFDNILAPLFPSTNLWDQLSAPGDAMDLITDAVDADAMATSGVNEIRDAILADSTPFNGADIAAILLDTGTTLPAQIAALNNISALEVENAVWDAARASHVGALTFGGGVLVETLNAGSLVAGSWTTLALQELADHLETNGTNPHGTGAWDATAVATDWTVAERNQIREALGVDGTKVAAVSGQLQILRRRLGADPIDVTLMQDATDTDPGFIRSPADGSALDITVTKIGTNQVELDRQ
jgi:hypothetical protein